MPQMAQYLCHEHWHSGTPPPQPTPLDGSFGMKALNQVRFVASVLATAGWLAPSTRAAAQNEGWGGEEAAAADEEAASPSAEDKSTDEEPASTEASPETITDPPPVDADPGAVSSLKETPDYLLGARYRGIIIPEAVLNWFMDGGQTVYVNGVGPELAIRKDKVEYILSAWLALYSMSPTAIKGSTDEEEAWEIVESELKSLYLTADYLGNKRLANKLELSYGLGVGLGILFGDLYRTQATLPAGGTRGNPDDYVPCAAENVPPTGGYCDDINDHYSGYSEPSWFNGGSKPALFPWLTGQVGLRYQPHDKFVARLDVGLGTSGLFFGLGADYGL